MTKTFRINFEKGINVVGDKAIIPEGFATILDNVDLRSGSIRPFRSPEYQFQVTNTTARSWSYRGRWFHSDDWKDYSGEYIGGIERVYATQEGNVATKTISGLEALLGTPRPSVASSVAKTILLAPPTFTGTVSYTGIGRLADGVGMWYSRAIRYRSRGCSRLIPALPTSPIQERSQQVEILPVSIFKSRISNTPTPISVMLTASITRVG